MMPPTHLLLAGILGLFALSATACDSRQPATYPERVPTRGTAVLPPAPDLYPKLAPVHYDDGSWSVHGVLETGKRLPKEPIAVKGYVAALHTCPEETKRCNPAPFVQLTDRKNAQGRRLLVGGQINPARDKLKIGELTTVKGRFATRSPDGLYFAPGGLLLFQPPEAETDEKAADKAQK